MKCCNSMGLLLARIMLALIFVWAGVGKFLAWDSSAAYMASKGMTAIPLFLGAAALIELLGGIALILGFKTRVAAFILFLFLIPVSFIFHDFWNLVDDKERVEQLIHFLSNIAIMGGLLALITVGPGSWAIDKKYCHPDEDCCK